MCKRKREARKEIARLVSEGASHQDIFNRMRGGVFRDRHLATILAATAEPADIHAHLWKVRGMWLVGGVQMAVSLFIGWQAGWPHGQEVGLILALIVAAIPALMLFGFICNSIHAYNLFVGFSALQIPPLLQSLSGAGWESAEAWVGVAITLALITYAIYVRTALFPRMGIFSARGGIYAVA